MECGSTYQSSSAGSIPTSRFNGTGGLILWAHSAGGDAFRSESLYHDSGTLIDDLYRSQGPSEGQFFTRDLAQFRNSLARVDLFGDEAPLIALDCCLDFPWREAAGCHRVVVMMTDEPFETGALQAEQLAMLPTLIEKIQRMRVMLYLVCPESDAFNELSKVEKSVYEVVDQQCDGLASVDFRQVLQEIGKSVSVCDWQMAAPDAVPRGIFSQACWTTGGTMSPKDST